MFHNLVMPNRDNLDQDCANWQCKGKKATHYHVTERSWVCFSCCQSINREALQRYRKYAEDMTKFKPVCISGADALVMLLQQGHTQ